jgi:hypothetical protein
MSTPTPIRLPRLGVIANLAARQNRHGRFPEPAMRQILGPFGWLRTSRSLADTAEIVADLRDWGAEAIAVSGGDGTLGAVVTEAVHSWGGPLPAFLPLPGGTSNNVARLLGHRGRQTAILRRFVRGLGRGEAPMQVHRLRTLRVSDPSRPRDVFGFVFGNGLVYEYDHYIHATGGPTFWNTLRALAWLSLRALLNRSAPESVWRPTPARIDIDGQSFTLAHFKTLIVYAAIALPSAFHPLPLPAPGWSAKFPYLINGMERLRLLRHLLAILRGTCASFGHHIGHGARLEIRAECGYMIDGELCPRPAGDLVTVSAGEVIRLWSAGPA